MTTSILNEAIEALKQREGAKKTEAIHYVTIDSEQVIGIKNEVYKWLKSMNLDAAIWTGLSYSEKTNKRRPTIEYVLNHLKDLEYSKRKHAEQYIRRTPKQIDTEFRRQIEFAFGWTHYD